MKFGVRKPNLKSSIKARTTGRAKRAVKKAVIPGYGKKGMGWVKDPKRAAYNKVYNKTTVGVGDIARAATKPSKAPHDEAVDSRVSSALPQDNAFIETPKNEVNERSFQFGANFGLSGCLSIVLGPIMLGFAIYSVIGSWELTYTVRRVCVAVIGAALLIYGIKRLRLAISVAKEIPPDKKRVSESEE